MRRWIGCSPIVRLLLTSLSLTFSVGAGQSQNFRVSNPSANAPEEVTIAINPLNSNWLVVGSNLRYVYLSTNGGESWSQSQLPAGTWGDPCVLFDGLGNLYYAHLANLSTGYFIDRLIVHRSTDAGLSWADSVEVGFNPPNRGQDKEWLGVDLTGSPYTNRLYMAWTQFDQYASGLPADSSRIRFSRSTDHGVTWSKPIRISDRAGDCLDDDNTVEGAVPAVGPNGEVYTTWSGPLGIMFDKSTNGGLTFGADHFVASQPGGWAFDIPGIYRCNGMPVTACDVSLSSPYRGTIYVLWSDQRNGIDNTDVFLAKSTDGGESWSSAAKVNTDMTVSHQFFPWLAIDQTTGYLYVVYYDRSNTSGNGTDVTLAQSIDAGETFRSWTVSTTSFTPVASVFFGDYTNIAAQSGWVYPVWMRMDSGTLSIWMARLYFSGSNVPASPALPSDYALLQNYPNPFNPSTTIDYTVGVSPAGGGTGGAVTLSVYDLLGRKVATLVQGERTPGRYSVTFEPRGLASGIYYYRLTAPGFVDQKSMLLIR